MDCALRALNLLLFLLPISLRVVLNGRGSGSVLYTAQHTPSPDAAGNRRHGDRDGHGSEVSGITERQRLARKRAGILLRHYAQSAVSDLSRAMAMRYERSDQDADTERFLLDLPREGFTSYLAKLRERSGWDDDTLRDILDRTAIVEVSNVCPYDCSMCYIDAPKVSGYLPWPHIQEIVRYLAQAAMDDPAMRAAYRSTTKPCNICCSAASQVKITSASPLYTAT